MGHRIVMRRHILASILAGLFLLPFSVGAQVNVWTSHGPEGAAVTAIATSPAAPATMYLGTWGGGVFRSEDGGAVWEPANRGLGFADIRALTVDPTDASRVFAGGWGGTMARSTDGGRTWSKISLGVPFGEVDAIVLDPFDPRAMFVAGYGYQDAGVFKSVDSGATWAANALGLPSPSIKMLVASPSQTGVLFACTDTGDLFTSDDGGASWRPWAADLARRGASGLVFDPTYPQVMYARAYGNGVYRSTDAGQHWVWSSKGLTDYYIWNLVADPADPSRLFVSTDKGVFRSDDKAASWHATGSQPSGASSRALGIASSSPATLLVSTEKGVSTSKDSGDSWVLSNSGLTNTSIDAIAQLSGDPAVLYASERTGRVHVSRDRGGKWELVGVIKDGVTSVVGAPLLTVDPSSPSTLYAHVWDRGLAKSIDGGSSWSLIAPGTFLGAFPDDRGATMLFLTGQQGLQRSDDGGATWRGVGTGLPGPWIGALVADPTNAHVLYAGAGFGLFKTLDAGETWLPARAGLETQFPAVTPFRNVTAIAVDRTSPDTVLVGADGGIFKSTNGGQSWQPASNGLEFHCYWDEWSFVCQERVAALAIDPARPQFVYAAVGNRVFRSTDAGGNWVQLGEPLPVGWIPGMVLDPSGDWLHLPTYSGGVFSMEIQDWVASTPARSPRRRLK